MNKVVLIILLAFCVVLSAFFSGSEMAFAKVNKVKLSRAVDKKEKGAKLAFSFVDNYSDTITTIVTIPIVLPSLS